MTYKNESLEKYSAVKLTAMEYYGTQINLGEMKHNPVINLTVGIIHTEPSKKSVLLFTNLLYLHYNTRKLLVQQKTSDKNNTIYSIAIKYKSDLNNIRVVAGILTTVAKEVNNDEVQQWRSIVHIYSQKFYRFPAYDLAILDLNKTWVFNQFVNLIPFARWDQDFDGVCVALAVYPTQSWAANKRLFSETLKLIQRRWCEWLILRSCRLYICTAYNNILKHAEIQGGGLICHGTNDPEEKDEKQGVLVGVTSLINIGLPSLHTRVGLFHKWVADSCHFVIADKIILFLGFLCFIIKFY